MAKVIFGSKAQAIRSIITTKYFKEGGLDIPLEAAKGIRIIGPRTYALTKRLKCA
jgi:hypothetical protein